MIIHPIDVEAFYFNDLPTNIKSKIIEDKITSILINLDNEKYKKYKDTVEFAKKSTKPLDYREFIKEYNFNDLINDILKDNRLYDAKGNLFNIIYKDDKHLLFLTKTTFIPVKLLDTQSYNVYFYDQSNELPTVIMTQVQAPNKNFAKESALLKINEDLKDKISDTILIEKAQ